MKKQDTNPQFYTDTGANVTARLKNNKTVFFENSLEAEKFADSRRSYKYQIFNGTSEFKREHVGYGVPL